MLRNRQNPRLARAEMETHRVSTPVASRLPPDPARKHPRGQRLTARDFDRQVAEFQVRVAVLDGFTALGIPVMQAVGQVCPGIGEL